MQLFLWGGVEPVPCTHCDAVCLKRPLRHTVTLDIPIDYLREPELHGIVHAGQLIPHLRKHMGKLKHHNADRQLRAVLGQLLHACERYPDSVIETKGAVYAD